MASNKPSCAICFSFLLSVFLLAFLIFIGYFATFLHHQEFREGKVSSANHLVIAFIIVGAILEGIQIVKSRKLYTSYWQQELLAIKQAYNKRQASGIRSRSINGRSAPSQQRLLQGRNCPEQLEVESLLEGSLPCLSKKQEKQIILRKLQYDVVKSYSNWYCLIFALKVCALAAYFQLTNVFEFVLQDSKIGQLSTLKIADRLTDMFWQDPYTSKDFMHVGLGLLVGRVLELANYYLVYRWRQNIKRDIIDAISLQQPLAKAPLGYGEEMPRDNLCDQTTLLGESTEEGMFLDRHTTLDHESAPLLLSQPFQQFRNRSTKLGGESEHSEGASSEQTRRTQQQHPHLRMSLSSNYSQAMAKATIVL